MKKTLWQRLVEMGWHRAPSRTNEVIDFDMHLFGFTVRRSFFQQSVESSEDAKKHAEVITEEAICELSLMLYKSLYESKQEEK